MGGGGGGRFSGGLCFSRSFFFLFLFLFRLSLSALDKAQAVRGDRAGGGAESKNESSSEAASAADRHVLIDPKVCCGGRVSYRPSRFEDPVC